MFCFSFLCDFAWIIWFETQSSSNSWSTSSTLWQYLSRHLMSLRCLVCFAGIICLCVFDGFVKNHVSFLLQHCCNFYLVHFVVIELESSVHSFNETVGCVMATFNSSAFVDNCSLKMVIRFVTILSILSHFQKFVKLHVSINFSIAVLLILFWILEIGRTSYKGLFKAA